MSSPYCLWLILTISCVWGEYCEEEYTDFDTGFEKSTSFNCPKYGDPEHFTRCCNLGHFWERKCCAPRRSAFDNWDTDFDDDFNRTTKIVWIVFGVIAFLIFGCVCLCACLPCCALAKCMKKRKSGGTVHQPAATNQQALLSGNVGYQNTPKTEFPTTSGGITYHPQSDYPPQGGPLTSYPPSIEAPNTYPVPGGPPTSYPPSPGGPPTSYPPLPGGPPTSYPPPPGGTTTSYPSAPGGVPGSFQPGPEGPPVFNPPEKPPMTSYLPPELSTYNPSYGAPYEPIQAYSADPPPYDNATRQQPFNPNA